MTLISLRQAVCEATQHLDKLGLFPLGMGCISGIDREQGTVVVKPAAIAPERLTPGDMVVMDPAGRRIEGNLDPASEVETHLALYQEFGTVGAMVSFYSPSATIFAQACRPIPCLGVLHARFFKGEIPVTRALRKPEVERNYAKGMATVIAERFARLSTQEIPGVIVAHHGAVAWGMDVAGACLKAQALEHVAYLALGARQLASPSEPLPGVLLDKHYQGTLG